MNSALQTVAKSPTNPPQVAGSSQERLIAYLTPLLQTMGYELVHLELLTHRQKVLRVFIDHFGKSDTAIGIEDCVKVTKALDEPLEKYSETDAVFATGYELEVSSPGVDRPLRKPSDFAKFAGREARIHVFRPLSAEELGNPSYHQRNPRQKNFLGTIRGMNGEQILLSVPASMGVAKPGAKKKKPKASSGPKTEEKADHVSIPLSLVSKANLEPNFDFENEGSLP